MSIYGTVRVKNGKYKIKGDFHHITPNMPIRNEDEEWRLVGVTNPREMIYIHTYGGESVFFENLSKGKIHASRCDNPACEFKGTVYLPFRIHCPDCLSKNTVIDLTGICKDTARIHTFMVCERSGAFNTLDKPIQFINVEFEGVSTILMSYLSIGEPKIGMRVVPIFKTVSPTHTIVDLSWVPENTPERALPEGFTFD
jgi:uncharacterized OB-fold protein